MEESSYIKVYERRLKRKNQLVLTKDPEHVKPKKSVKILPAAAMYFCELLEYAQKAGYIQMQYIFKWLIGEYFLFSYGVKILSKGKLQGYSSKFHEGYTFMKNNDTWKHHFTQDEWGKVFEMVNFRYNLSSVKSGLKTRLQKYRKSPEDYVERKRVHFFQFGYHQMKKVSFDRQSTKFCSEFVGGYFIKDGVSQPPSKKSIIWKVIPNQFYKMEPSSTMEIWKDHFTDHIIGGRMRGGVPQEDRSFLRSYIIDIYNYQWTVRRTDARSALTETMRAIGPLVNWREGKGDKYVSFYRNKLKINETCGENALQLELVHEQCAHRLLLEIILLMFCDFFWPVFDDIWRLKYPFTDLSDDLLKYFSCPELMKDSVPSYPLFITKNHCNKIHTDEDRSTYTMFMSSNPGMDNHGGDLVILDYGIQIPVLDGDLFFIRGADTHGTSYRPLPKEAVFVVGIAINEKLGHAYEFVNEN